MSVSSDDHRYEVTAGNKWGTEDSIELNENGTATLYYRDTEKAEEENIDFCWIDDDTNDEYCHPSKNGQGHLV